MKTAVWTYTAALGFASLAVAALGGMFGNIYHYKLGDKPLPFITDLLVQFPLWAFAIPLPWLFAAILLSRHGAATPARVFAFAGISTLAITFLFMFTAVALTLPFISIIVSMR